MPTYKIYTEISLGMSHSGCVDADGEAEITLTDSQVETLKKIMEDAYAEGEDLEELDLSDTKLEEKDPDLYKLLYQAYYNCAYEAEYEFWVEEGYHGSEVLDGVDWEYVRKICKERYGYNPEAEEEEYEEEEDAEYDDNFRDWFRDNIINSDKLIDFERNEDVIGLYMDFQFDSPILIPPALVDEFLKSQE